MASPARREPLLPQLVQPRWFALPFLAVIIGLLIGSLETTRRTDRWAGICFLVCTLLLFFHFLPPLFAPSHPAGRPEGDCWKEVCDVLAAEAVYASS